MPEVSVIILTYNRPQMLRKALLSVTAQTFHDFEIIIIDDASQDESTQMIESFADPRITYVRNSFNQGEGKSRNTGLQHATGRYVAFLDDDDEWLPKKLELQTKLLNRCPDAVGGVYTGARDVDAFTGRLVRTRIPDKRGDIFLDLLRENFLSTSSVLLRRECFERCGQFDDEIPAGLDYDMWLRIATQFRFEFVQTILVQHGIHPQRLTEDMQIQIRGRESLLEKYRHLRPCYLEYTVFTLAMLQLLIGNAGLSRRTCIAYLRTNPFSPRMYAALLLSLVGSTNARRFLKKRETASAAAPVVTG